MTNAVGVIYATIVIECPTDAELQKAMAWVQSRIKSAVDMSDRGAITVVLTDRDGKPVGQNIVGAPTKLTQELLDKLLPPAA